MPEISKNSILDLEKDEYSLKVFLKNLRAWFFYLKKYWIIIFLISFFGGLAGFFYASSLPVNYEAKTVFIVEEGKSSSSGLGGLASLAGQFGIDVGGNSGGGLFSGDNILLYFKSVTLAREVLLSEYNNNPKVSIADIYVKVYDLNDKWLKNKRIGKINFPVQRQNVTYNRIQDSLLINMIDNILKTQFNVLKTDKKAGFIEVSSIMRNEGLAKRYCERIVELAVKKYVTLKVQRQQNLVDKLQFRVDSISNLLSLKTSKSAILQNSSSTMDINPLYKAGTNVAVETTIRDKTMLSSIFASITQNLELAKFNLSQEMPIIQIVDYPISPLKKLKTSRLKMALSFSFFLTAFLIFILILNKTSGPFIND